MPLTLMLRSTVHQLLQACRYGEALDDALDTGQPIIVVSLIEELAARHGIQAALKHRPEASLVKLLTCLNRCAMHPAHTATALQMVGHVLDVHHGTITRSAALLRLVEDLRGRVGAEVRVQRELHELAGAIDMLAE